MTNNSYDRTDKILEAELTERLGTPEERRAAIDRMTDRILRTTPLETFIKNGQENRR